MSKEEWASVLIYKRTHTGDPGPDGVFGRRDCLGKIRGYRFEGVIGVGGSSDMPRNEGIDGRITWVGLGAQREQFIRPGYRGPLISFNKFVLLDKRGPKLQAVAPALARYFFSKHRRYMLSDGLDDHAQEEIDRILNLADSQRTNCGAVPVTTKRCTSIQPAKSRLTITRCPYPQDC